MTTTQVEPSAPTRTTRSWWPDRRPVQARWAATWLGLGLVMVGGTVLAAFAGISELQDTAFVVAFGLAWIAQAGLEVARPGSDRLSIVVYRVACVAVPVLAASFAIALLLTS